MSRVHQKSGPGLPGRPKAAPELRKQYGKSSISFNIDELKVLNRLMRTPWWRQQMRGVGCCKCHSKLSKCLQVHHVIRYLASGELELLLVGIRQELTDVSKQLATLQEDHLQATQLSERLVELAGRLPPEKLEPVSDDEIDFIVQKTQQAEKRERELESLDEETLEKSKRKLLLEHQQLKQKLIESQTLHDDRKLRERSQSRAQRNKQQQQTSDEEQDVQAPARTPTPPHPESPAQQLQSQPQPQPQPQPHAQPAPRQVATQTHSLGLNEVVDTHSPSSTPVKTPMPSVTPSAAALTPRLQRQHPQTLYFPPSRCMQMTMRCMPPVQPLLSASSLLPNTCVGAGGCMAGGMEMPGLAVSGPMQAHRPYHNGGYYQQGYYDPWSLQEQGRAHGYHGPQVARETVGATPLLFDDMEIARLMANTSPAQPQRDLQLMPQQMHTAGDSGHLLADQQTPPRSAAIDMAWWQHQVRSTAHADCANASADFAYMPGLPGGH